MKLPWFSHILVHYRDTKARGDVGKGSRHRKKAVDTDRKACGLTPGGLDNQATVVSTVTK